MDRRSFLKLLGIAPAVAAVAKEAAAQPFPKDLPPAVADDLAKRVDAATAECAEPLRFDGVRLFSETYERGGLWGHYERAYRGRREIDGTD